ncbi:unnamed protein product [Penicillium salamii]|nr:unnamed protein product [Penicillium salamii]CAG8282373.1 unnamed protein product [Penicillium salamii]
MNGTRDSSNPHSQFHSASQSLRRKRPVASGSTSPFDHDSFESAQSDEKSIFNAIRVATPDKPNGRFYASLNKESPVHEQGLAVNMARFVFSDSQASASPTDLPRQRQKPVRKPGDHRKIFSDQNWHALAPRRPDSKPVNPNSPGYHRKTVSLGTTDNPRGPRWPGTTQPAVVLVQPRYPAPERSPTPPGLPSFGSPEAMRYSARFLMRDNAAHTRANGDSDAQSSGSYGGTIRRFFGFSTPTPRIDVRSVTGIGRAEDGTMVRGRFPYRQSGHGTNVARPLHDHLFHHRLPTARFESGEISQTYAETANKRSPRDQRSRPYEPSHLSRRRSLSPGGGFSFPSRPTSAVVAGARPPRPVALLGLPRDLSAPTRLSSTTANPGEPSPGASGNTNHPSSVSSRIHSFFSAVCGDGTSDAHEDTSIFPTLTSLINFQSCSSCLSEHEEPNDSLAPTTSRDTYSTARSQVSPAGSQTGSFEESRPQVRSLQAWVSSMYSVMFPTLVNPATL